MRISDWSSDVCSSDLPCALQEGARIPERPFAVRQLAGQGAASARNHHPESGKRDRAPAGRLLSQGRRAHEAAHVARPRYRSGERRGGKEWDSTGRSRWAPIQSKKKSDPKKENTKT